MQNPGILGRIWNQKSSGTQTSISARLLSLPLTALLSFGTTAIILKFTGPENYASLMLCTSIFVFIVYADFGVGSSLVNLVAAYEQNVQQLSNQIYSALKLLSIISLCFLASLLLLVQKLSLSELLGIPDGQNVEWDRGVFMALAISFVGLPFTIGQRILIGLGQNSVVILVSIVNPFMTFSLGSLALLLDLHTSYVLTIMAISFFVTNLCLFVISMRKLRLKFFESYGQMEKNYSSLLNFGVTYTILVVTASTLLPGMRMNVASHAGLTESAVLSILLQVYQPLWSLITAAGLSLWPIYAKQRTSGVQLLPSVLRFVKNSILVGMIAATLGAAIFPWIISIISSEKITVSALDIIPLFFLLTVQATQFAFGMALTDTKGIRIQAIGSCLIPITLTLLGVSTNYFKSSASALWIASLIVIVVQITPNFIYLLKTESDK